MSYSISLKWKRKATEKNPAYIFCCCYFKKRRVCELFLKWWPMIFACIYVRKFFSLSGQIRVSTDGDDGTLFLRFCLFFLKSCGSWIDFHRYFSIFFLWLLLLLIMFRYCFFSSFRLCLCNLVITERLFCSFREILLMLYLSP